MLDTTFDKGKAEIFGARLLEVLNSGALAVMLSIGHRTGLFDAMRTLPPRTSAEIAAAAGLQERYVREWLGAMVTGRIVDYNAEDKTYRLPAEHAALLTRAAAVNMAATMQWIAVLGSVEDETIEVFRRGGGVPYSSFRRFHEVMAEESAQTVLPALDNAILPLVPGLPEKLAAGINVMEVGCGSGRALNQLAKTYPNSHFVGYDISSEGLFNACNEAERLKLENINFEIKDVAQIDEAQQFDLVLAFDAIHDQAAPAVVLQNIANALRPDGVFLMQDIAGSSHLQKNVGQPISTYLYTVSCLHCMSVSLAANGQGLGAMWGEELAQTMLKDAGFNTVEVHRLPHDIVNYYYVVRKD